MEKPSNEWSERARVRLNRLLDRINEFDSKGGFGTAFRRGLDRFRLEQERLRREMQNQRPVARLVEIRQAYARLEVPFGSDQQAVRGAYRRLMRRYHPDRHVNDPERERVATEIAQKLTVSYNLLVEFLDR